MKFSKYIVALLAASMIIPAIAGCCGRGGCGRRPAGRQGGKVVKPAPRGKTNCRNNCRRGGCCR